MTSISRFDRTELYIVRETYDNEEINYYIVLDKEHFNLIIVNPIFIIIDRLHYGIVCK